MTLIATSQATRYGDDLSSGFLLARVSIGSLPAGGSFFNLDSGLVAYRRPSSGTYFLTMTLDENQGGTNYYYDLIAFTNTQTFGAACTQDATTLCLVGGRFAVTSNWSVPSQGTSGIGTALPLVGGDTGYFWFFAPNAAELMVKMVDGRAVNGRYWLFYGALSDVRYTITATDTLTGAIRTYQNPSGNLASVADVSAFLDSGGPIPTPTPPAIPTPTPTVPPTGSLAGSWQGTITSSDIFCPYYSSFQAIQGSFTQVGTSFAGTFSLPGNSSGFFQGVILGNSLSGVFTTTSGGCTGSGNFSGTLSGTNLSISAPNITTSQFGCAFCQGNSVTLHRTGP